VLNAVRTCFKKYAVFSGGASRPEYWWFFLFYLVVAILLALTRLRPLVYLWYLVALLPLLAVTVRRHHDAGRSGWWIFTGLIWPWAVILLCYPSKTFGNRYVPGAFAGPEVTEAGVHASTLTCPHCGKLRLPGQNYCGGCGARLDVE